MVVNKVIHCLYYLCHDPLSPLYYLCCMFRGVKVFFILLDLWLVYLVFFSDYYLFFNFIVCNTCQYLFFCDNNNMKSPELLKSTEMKNVDCAGCPFYMNLT